MLLGGHHLFLFKLSEAIVGIQLQSEFITRMARSIRKVSLKFGTTKVYKRAQRFFDPQFITYRVERFPKFSEFHNELTPDT